MGERPELTGGGLRRSLTLCPQQDKMIDFDGRILGSGEFVSQLREKGLLNDLFYHPVGLAKLPYLVAEYYNAVA